MSYLNGDFEECHFENADLRHCRLRQCTVSRCNIWYSKLQNCDIDGADINKSNVNECILRDVEQKRGTVTNSQVDDSGFVRTSIVNTIMTNSVLRQCSHTNSTLRGCKITMQARGGLDDDDEAHPEEATLASPSPTPTSTATNSLGSDNPIPVILYPPTPAYSSSIPTPSTRASTVTRELVDATEFIILSP